MAKFFLLAAVALAMVSSVQGHICAIEPRQRGAFDISTGGNPSCFRHGPPCGGQPAGEPKASYAAGSQQTFHFQQNYNHFALGQPGYLDVAWAVGPDPKDEDFQVFGAIGDYNAHWQGQQHNFSLAVTIPNTDCSHCVVRMRYQSNKPGEQTFYQCSDVNFYAGSASGSGAASHSGLAQMHQDKPVAEKKVVRQRRTANIINPGKFNLYGLADMKVNTGVALALLNLTAVDPVRQVEVYPAALKQFEIRTAKLVARGGDDAVRGAVFTDIVTPFGTETLLFAGTSDTTLGAVADMIFQVNPTSAGTWLQYKIAVNGVPQSMTVNSLVTTGYFDGNQNEKIFALGEVADETVANTFKTILYAVTLDFASGHANFQELTTFNKQANTYINVLWMVWDSSVGALRVLFQNENAAVVQDSQVWTVEPTAGGSVRHFTTKNPELTYQQISAYNGTLFAVSPGPTLPQAGARKWAVYTIDEATGELTLFKEITGSGLPLGVFWGGGVYGGVTKDGALLHSFSIMDKTSVVAEIDLSSRTSPTAWSQEGPWNMKAPEMRTVMNLVWLPYY